MSTIGYTRIKRNLLNGAILFFFINLFVLCNKEADVPENNNEVNATVTQSTGSIIEIQARKEKAVMGCASFGGGTFVAGTNDANAAVYINLYATGVMCITSAGTYSFGCQYRPDVTSVSTPIYTNHGVQNPGSITFTVINDHYMEGSFNAVCRTDIDSVIVSGTFKGNY